VVRGGEPSLAGGDNLACNRSFKAVYRIMRLIAWFPTGACNGELPTFENAEAAFYEQRFEQPRKFDVALHGRSNGSPSVPRNAIHTARADDSPRRRNSPLPRIGSPSVGM